MQSNVHREIEKTVNEMKKIRGIIGIVLFGSYSRGDYEEGSDIDLIIIFKNKDQFMRNNKKIYKITAKSGLFFQAIILTLDEFKKSALLKSVLRDGKIYFAEEEVKSLFTTFLKPYALITYTTANLDLKERVTFTQRLAGRGKGKYRYNGLLNKLDGYKVGRGTLMIPIKNMNILTEFLDKQEVNYYIRYVWV